MRLTLHERLVLAEYIPFEGRYADMVEVRKIKELLAFTPDEMQEFEVKYEGGGVRFNAAKAITYLKDIPMTEWITVQIQTALRTREAEGKIREQDLTLYEKFIVQYTNT